MRCAASLCDEQRTRTCSWGGSKSAVLSARYLYALSDVSWSAAWASTDTTCPGRQSWKVRWFQLNPSKKTLSYHEAPGTSALHVIDLHLATEATQIGVGTCLCSAAAQRAIPLAHRLGGWAEDIPSGEKEYKNKPLFKLVTPERVWYMCADSEEQRVRTTPSSVRCHCHRPHTSIPHSFLSADGHRCDSWSGWKRCRRSSRGCTLHPQCCGPRV